MSNKDKEHEAQDFTKNMSLYVNGDCCMRQIYGTQGWAGKKMAGPKGLFGTEVLRIPRGVTNRVAELEMGRESRRGKIFLASKYCCRFKQMGEEGNC